MDVTDEGFPIQEGVPLPAKKFHPAIKYRFGDIPEGGMLLVECSESDRRRVMQTLCVSAHGWCKRRGFANIFTCRSVENGVGVFRVKQE